MIHEKYLVGTDIGTSGTKTVVMSASGKILAESYLEHDIIIPKALWAEQWAEVWVNAAKQTIKDAVKKAGIPENSVAGICISGLYGGSGVPVDSDMKSVRPCIIWMDRRAEEECRQIESRIGTDSLFEVTGNGIDTYFGFAKILWIKNNEPENWEKIKCFVAPNQYVIYNLTGRLVMDHTSAGNLGGIYDLRKHAWSSQMLEAMGIPRDKLPQELVEPNSIVGGLSAEAAKELGIAAGTPVCAGCIDCLSSTLATGVLNANEHTAIIGTSINWGVIHSSFPTSPSFITMPYSKDSLHMNYTYGGASTAGALPKWFRDQLIGFNGGTKKSFAELDAEAESVPAGSKGLIVLPYFMGERSPIWDDDAKGTIVGLTLQHTRAHLYRAFLESVAYSLRHIMETSQIALPDKPKLTLIGGATRSKLWKQIFADVTGATICCSEMNVEAPIGDALLAGIGTGVITEYEDVKKWVDFSDIVEPNPEMHERYNAYFELYKKLYLALKSTMKEMSDLQ